jgi:predicted neuraminidase
MNTFLTILIFLILVYIFAWLGELHRCMQRQIKHNDFWEKRNINPFLDFCKHL